MRTPSDTPPLLMMVLAEMTNGQTITYWHGLDTLAQSDGTNVSYFEYDGLGSVRQVVDDAGGIGLSQTFDPYRNPYASAGSASTSLGYTGEQTDGNGFVFLRARYYNPTVGRFLQADPSRQENNPYQYAAGNPVMFTDPSGHDPWQCDAEPDPALCRREYLNNHRASPSVPPIGIDFEPNIDALQFRLWIDPNDKNKGFPSSQFDIPGYEGTTGYHNFCGTVSVGAIVQYLLQGDGPTTDKIIDTLINSGGDDTGIITDAESKLPVGWQVLRDLVGMLGGSSDLTNNFKMDYNEYATNIIRPNLDGTRWPIILINIDKLYDKNTKQTYYFVVPFDSGDYECYSQVVLNSDGTPVKNGDGTDKTETICPGINHFVVITGLSTANQWGKGVAWQWVRIFNPIVNGPEYYLAQDLFTSQISNRNTLWICLAKSTPGC